MDGWMDGCRRVLDGRATSRGLGFYREVLDATSCVRTGATFPDHSHLLQVRVFIGQPSPQTIVLVAGVAGAV
jgi:hypothetical protein